MVESGEREKATILDKKENITLWSKRKREEMKIGKLENQINYMLD